jgi:TolB protein
MLHIFLKAGSTLFTLFSLLIVLSLGVFATNSGEIAFESNQTGNWEIFLLDLRTSAVHNLTNHPADELSPAWSPDGSRIVFSADRSGDGQPELYVMNADGSDVQRISAGSSGYRNASWSPDGNALVVSLGFGQMYVMNADGSGEQWLAYGFTPSFSPDGRRVLYSADTRINPNGDVYLYDRVLRQITNLTANPANDWGAAWSPNGRQIVFVSSRAGRSHIYVMSPDGKDIRAVTTQGANDLSPGWSPDSTQIVYTSGENGNTQLYLIDVDGSNPHPITAIRGDNHAPAWRPQ